MNPLRATELEDGTWEYPCPSCPTLITADEYEDVLEATADHILEAHDDL